MSELAIDLKRGGAPVAAALARIPGVAWVLVVLAIVFSLSSETFLTLANLLNVSAQSVTLLMLALPMTLIIMTEGVDISMGAVLTLAGIILARVTVEGGSLPLAVAAAAATGLAFGVGNGVMVAWLRLPAFVVTLGTMGIAQGLSLVVTDGGSIVGLGDGVRFFADGTVGGIPVTLLIGALAYAVTHLLLYRTRFGTYVFAIGGNPEALELAGVRAGLHQVAVYAFAGVMTGLASLLMTARMSAAHPTAALGMEFEAIAAVIVGGTSFRRGNGWLPGTLLGVLTVGALRNGLNLLEVPSAAQVACVGLLVIVALLIDGLKETR